MMDSVLALDPAGYRSHPIHGEGRVWAETNCYVDLWVELLHAWGCDPVAALPFTLGIDFEGDQWTFFKFPLGDLYQLYGLDVQELALWRPLREHLVEQVGRGHPVLIELDSYYLPDTAGTAYRSQHVKTTVAVAAIDARKHTLGYFHNRGYYQLGDADFTALFDPTAYTLPPYAEFVKRRCVPASTPDHLLRASLQILRRELRRIPDTNPFPRFRQRFEADLDGLLTADLDGFHQYSFATLRQFGACYELASTYLHWVQERAGTPLEGPVAAFADIAAGAKALQFRLARAVAGKKRLDLDALDRMGDSWHTAMTRLKELFL